jgi:hypothetical protein
MVSKIQLTKKKLTRPLTLPEVSQAIAVSATVVIAEVANAEVVIAEVEIAEVEIVEVETKVSAMRLEVVTEEIELIA